MKKLVFILVIVCISSISFAFMRQEAPKYKNLKVLPKNITKPEMDSIMKHFSLSLGVKCGFCHVRNEETKKFDFAGDEKGHKKIARQMFTMMNKINKRYFDEEKDEHKNVNRIPEVSCYTCHRGEEHPENRPPAPPPGENKH